MMKSSLWIVLGIAALAALAWHFWPALSPLLEGARNLETVKVREMNPMR